MNHLILLMMDIFKCNYFQTATILAILDKIMDMNTGKFKKLCEI